MRLHTWCVGLFCCIACSAHATTVEFRPNTTLIAVGSLVGVDVYAVLDLGEQIGAFDITVGWSEPQLSYDSVVFDVHLDGPDNSIQDVVPGAGTANIAEVSLDVLSNQTGLTEFRLFQLSLIGGAPGVSPLDFSAVLLSDALGDALPVTTVGNSITVVPVPAAVWLFGSGLLGLVGIARRKKA